MSAGEPRPSPVFLNTVRSVTFDNVSPGFQRFNWSSPTSGWRFFRRAGWKKHHHQPSVRHPEPILSSPEHGVARRAQTSFQGISVTSTRVGKPCYSLPCKSMASACRNLPWLSLRRMPHRSPRRRVGLRDDAHASYRIQISPTAAFAANAA